MEFLPFLTALKTGTIFAAVAVTLFTACAPGWYDLTGSGSSCHPCPVGSYCPGGWPAALSGCPSGSTSAANSTSSDACECREGYYWDATLNLCTACPAGSFKDVVGSLHACDGTCPEGTTSPSGAISIRECSCVGDAIDTDPLAENFTCTDLTEMSASFSGSTLLASAEATVFSFSGKYSGQRCFNSSIAARDKGVHSL